MSASSVLAQPALDDRNFPAERFRPAIGADGILDTEAATIPSHLTWDAMLWLGYANDPLVLTRNDGVAVEAWPLVAHRVNANLIGSIALIDRLQVGFDLPVAIYQTAANDIAGVAESARNISAGGLGNLRLVPKLRLLREQDFGVSVAILAGVTLPTKTANAYLGDSGAAVVPEIAVSRRLGSLTLAANLSYLAREKKEVADLVVDDELGFHAGASYDLMGVIDEPLIVAATIAGGASAKEPYANRNQSPLEALFGVTYAVIENVDVTTAFGVGLSSGFGTPDFRVLAGLRVRTERERPVEPAPVAPAAPVVERDSDGDGLLDTKDACPNEPEDKDDFADDDGCPDPDNDNDGVYDVSDQCPRDPEDRDGFQDDDGCVDPDNDGDGILDVGDTCPNEAEDKDNFEDDDGCPDPDNDADNVPDYMDNCPNEPGDPAFQGCKAMQKVKLTADRIEIIEKVYFDTNKATIQARSFELLDNVAKVLNDHPEIARVRVEGHTDDVGSAVRNMKLSQDRAESVRNYLIKKGIAPERIEARGFGEERPLVPNKGAKNRAINRRVEFVVVSGAR